MTMAMTTASATRLPPRGRALRFAAFGGPEVLTVEDMDLTPAAMGEAVVAVRAASINPSDVKNVAGRMRQTVPPRTPGRDFAGIVVDGPSAWLGARVWGTGGDIGFKRDGSHAEYLRLPVEALARMPTGLEFQEAAAVGVNYITAKIGLDYATLSHGETLVVIGETGGVGGAACVIGAARGARVLAACRGTPASASPARHAGAECIDITATDLATAVAELTNGQGADVIYDCVGRPDLTQAALASLGFRGRLVVIAGTPGEQVPLELIPFYRRECRLIGVDSLKRSAAECAPMMEALRPGFEDGTHPAPAIAAAYDLSRGPEAYAEVARGTRGRILLTMGDS